jgi:hypothetical protein
MNSIELTNILLVVLGIQLIRSTKEITSLLRLILEQIYKPPV